MLQEKAYLLPKHLLSLVHFLSPLLVEDRDVICLVHFCENGERAVLFLDRILDISLVRQLYLIQVQHIGKLPLVSHQLNYHAELFESCLLAW